MDILKPVRCPKDHTVLAYADTAGVKLNCPKCHANYRHPEK